MTNRRRVVDASTSERRSTSQGAPVPPPRSRRRAALIATAVALPVVVIAALVLSAIAGSTSKPAGPLPALELTGPPDAAANAAPCAKVLEQLPVSLGRLAPRVVHPHPQSPFVVAWGDPAVVLRCGVARPRVLRAGSSAEFYAIGPSGGPYFWQTTTDGANVFVTVDRAVYVSITVPTSYQGADEVVPLSRAIARALPAVCATAGEAPAAGRCVNRA